MSDCAVAKGNSGDMVIKVKDIEQIRSHNTFLESIRFIDYRKLDNHIDRNI
nr:MAG TPA: hypothetical protein [Caudoviricetes sp.]